MASLGAKQLQSGGMPVLAIYGYKTLPQSALSPWLFSHRRTTLGIGHAVDSPLPSVSLYMLQQHLYSLRRCSSHFSGL